MNADSIKIETNEDGFWLWITDVGGVRHPWRITDPEALYDHVKAVIGPWLRERDLARQGRMHEAADVREAYDATDYKHPEWYSVHADLYDQREGK